MTVEQFKLATKNMDYDELYEFIEFAAVEILELYKTTFNRDFPSMWMYGQSHVYNIQDAFETNTPIEEVWKKNYQALVDEYGEGNFDI